MELFDLSLEELLVCKKEIIKAIEDYKPSRHGKTGYIKGLYMKLYVINLMLQGERWLDER